VDSWWKAIKSLDSKRTTTEETLLAIFTHHHGFKGIYVGTTDFVFLF